MPNTATTALIDAAQAPVALTSVHPSSQGWLGRFQARNAEVTLPHIINQLEQTSLVNLRNARDGVTAEHIGNPNSDSEVYKVLEAIAWEVARTGTTDFDEFVASTVELLQQVQQDDGYLNSWGQRQGYRHFSDLAMGQELFTGSHLLKAAAALSRIGRDELMDVARRWADLVVREFREGDGYDGHPGIEGSLVEFYRETGNQDYLETARAILDRRGQNRLTAGPLPSTFFQDHEPVREATEALGHARRQMYLDAGCADVWAEDPEDVELGRALVKRWESAHLTKMYVSGGLGSRHFDESFGAPYELPASRAYAETCASVADVSVNHRMLLLTGQARYADAIEKILYNSLTVAVSEQGDKFFASNPLQVRGKQRDEANNRIERASWNNHACCPTALTRVISSMGAYMVTTKGATLSIQQWLDGEIELPESVGQGKLVISTNYPADGHIKLRLEGTPVPGARLRMRVPGWCEVHTLNGRSALVLDGYMEQPLTEGFQAQLEFQMDPRFVVAHPRVDAVRGCRALLRGPVLYCAEGTDNPQLESLVFVPKAELLPAEQEGGLPGMRVLANHRRQPSALYSRTMIAVDPEITWATMVPYFQWGNRGPNPMRVWLPVV